MTQLRINIPVEKTQEVLDDLCEQFGYSSDSGLTQTQFVRLKVIDFLKKAIRERKKQKAQEELNQQSYADTDAIGIN